METRADAGFQDGSLDHDVFATDSFPNTQAENILEEQTLFAEDQLWLRAVENCIKNNLSNYDYTVNRLACDMAISERHLRRRLKQLLGLKPAQYQKSIRLQAAYELLAIKRYKTITQVAYAVGFRSVDAFRCNFQQAFGQTPTYYLNV